MGKYFSEDGIITIGETADIGGTSLSTGWVSIMMVLTKLRKD